MASDWREPFRAAREKTAAVINARNAEARRGLERLEAEGRKAYAKAINTGERVKAATQAELRELGRGALAGGKVVVKDVVKKAAAATNSSPQKPSRPSKPPASQRANVTRAGHGIDQQFRAGLSGAVDEFTFGLADPALAAASAIVHPDLTKGDALEALSQRYEASMAQKRAEDANDAANYAIARNTGRVAGFAGSMLATGGFGGAGVLARVAGVAPKVAKAANATRRIAKLTPGGLNTLAATGGAASGVVGQAITDGLTGHQSDVRDYVGAAAGGTLGALTMRAGVPGGRVAQTATRVVRDPRVAGAVDGASTTALQALLNGENASFEDVAESARAGAVSARIGDVAGKYGSNALPKKGLVSKEKLGESLSVLKSIASGDGNPLWGRKIPEFEAILPSVKEFGLQKKIPLSKSHTIADHVTPKAIVVEAKFGASPNLRPPQRRARRELPAGHYRVDHWLPSDAGRIVSALFGAQGNHWDGGEGEWR